MTAEDLACKDLESFNKLVHGMIDSELDNIEKGKLPKKKTEVTKDDIKKSTEVVSTATEMGEKEMAEKSSEAANVAVEEQVLPAVAAVVVDESKPVQHPDTHDEQGNPILIGHCRKSVVIITNDLGVETHYGSSVIAADWLNVTPATVRARCRKDEFVDENGRTWEEVPLSNYNALKSELGND